MQEELLAVLRKATAGQHARIEQLLHLEESFGLDRYSAVLQGFELFLRHWEPRAEHALPAHLCSWFRARTRSAFARADLAALGVPALEGPVALPALHGTAGALGSMYVLEGSALGGQVVAARARSQLGLLPGEGASYFSGWGADTGRMWREFRQVLASHDHAPDRPGAGAAAAATFEALIEVFGKVPHAV